jgi:hypothetical protein
MPVTINGTNGVTFNDSSVQGTSAIGFNQTWQNVIGSRAKQVTYQNTTGRPISVSISFIGNFSNPAQLWVHTSSANILTAGVMVEASAGGDYYTGNATTPSTGSTSVIIPNNIYYQLYDPDNTTTVTFWAELR